MNAIKRKANLKKLQLPNNMEQQDEARINIDSQSAGTECLDVKLSAAEVKERRRLLPRRTKLDDFVLKRPPPINDADDFKTPQKKFMPAAPAQKPVRQKKQKHKHEKRKKQPSIKSALMRNELLFSEIVAQHALADNFSPSDMQLALMLSKSETEQTCVQSNEPVDKVVDIRAELQKYGFRAAPQKDYDEMAAAFSGSATGKRRNKCKWANKITALTLRNAEKQSKKLQQRIEQVLQKYVPAAVTENIVKIAYVPVSAMLNKLLTCESSAYLKNETINLALETYFVPDLFDVCQLPAGHLLKNWSAIPGREMSPTRNVASALSSSEQNISSDLPALATALQHSAPPCLNVSTAATSNDNAQLTTNISPAQSTIQHDQLQCNSPIVGPNSPDIFENSMCEASEHDLAVLKAVLTDDESEADLEEIAANNITTYEIYSSDEEKDTAKTQSTANVKETTTAIMDLTQIHASNESEQIVALNEFIEIADEPIIEVLENISTQHKRRKTSLSVLEQHDASWEAFKIPQINSNKHKSRSMNELLPNDLSAGCIRRTQSVNLHNRINPQLSQTANLHNRTNPQLSQTASDSNLSEQSASSIDLTQTSCSDESDDELVMLSDDDEVSETKEDTNTNSDESETELENAEISNKALNFSIADVLGEEILISDDENSSASINACKLNSNSAILDDIVAKNNAKETEQIIHCDIDTDSEETESELDTDEIAKLHAKYASKEYVDAWEAEILVSDEGNSTTTIKDNCKKTAFDDSLADALALAATLEEPSFLCSPSESSAPLKRFSSRRSGLKLQKLLSNLANTERDSDTEVFNEFDHLMSDNKTTTTQPSGLQQLLTAEIQLKPSQLLCSNTSQTSAGINTNEQATLDWQEVHLSGVTYLVREAAAAAPVYEEWSTEKLHQELDKFGVKCLKRHQAIKILDHIYRMTHPIVLEDKKAQKKSKEQTQSSIFSKKSLKFSDCNGELLLNNANKIQATLLENEECIFQSNINKKTIFPLLPLHIAWYNLVASSADLQERIFCYEPIDFKDILDFFKRIKYRYKPQHLRAFLDNRGIMFSYEAASNVSQI